MPSLQQLRRRLKSIKSIHQITKAMEMIATSKMQRATRKVSQAKSYAISSKEILENLARFVSHPLFEKREVKNIALLFFTSDRGLCGGFNTALNREFYNFMKKSEDLGQNVFIITMGKRGRDFVTRFYRRNLLADFSGIKDEILYEEATPIAHLVIKDFLNKKVDQVLILYSQFISSFIQKPILSQLLPINPPTPLNPPTPFEYLLEPKPEKLLEILIPQFVEVQVFQKLLESKASEHSARMLAMKNATENAEDLMDELYLTYHSTRQAAITSELTDMITAKRAMEED